MRRWWRLAPLAGVAVVAAAFSSSCGSNPRRPAEPYCQRTGWQPEHTLDGYHGLRCITSCWHVHELMLSEPQQVGQGICSCSASCSAPMDGSPCSVSAGMSKLLVSSNSLSHNEIYDCKQQGSGLHWLTIDASPFCWRMPPLATTVVVTSACAAGRQGTSAQRWFACATWI